jgi:hypothetical protein
VHGDRRQPDIAQLFGYAALAASLGLTFSYNVTIGIPVYIEIARFFGGPSFRSPYRHNPVFHDAVFGWEDDDGPGRQAGCQD